ncbi:CLR6 [Sanghuangporus baumii]
MSKRRVAYYYDNDVGMFSYGYGHAMKPQRIRMTHDLVATYGMLDKMQVLRPRRADATTMTRFHTDEYIHFLTKVTPETAEELTYHGTRFLVGDDNPPFDGVFEFCSISAGGSIDAAKRIASGATDIAINWAGGLHHAKKREASGFCYVNDIVLGILELLRTFPRVLYIDIDCHHGDGVEEAFYTTDRVMTCSFHKFGEYFPGTGHVEDHGRGKGLGYAVNVPLRDGLTDEAFKSVFEPVIQRILEWFQPSAVVLQCGSDSLAGDKLGCFNLTMEGHANCAQYIRKSGLPLILLGGGGYTVKNVCRTWAYETACALNIEDEIDRNLPWNAYFEWFGPRYRLEVLSNNMADMNTKDDGYLDNLKETIFRQISRLPFAPSVQMQEVPSESLGEHLGMPEMVLDESKENEDLDKKLGEQYRRVFGLMRNDSSSSEDDEPGSIYEGYESEEGRRGRSQTSPALQHMYPHQHAKRMSIYNTSHPSSYSHSHVLEDSHSRARGGPRGARRFFHSNAVWDPVLKTVVPKDGILDGADGTDPFDLERRGRTILRMNNGDMDVDSTAVSVE